MTKKLFIACAMIALAAVAAKADTILADAHNKAGKLAISAKAQVKRPSWTYNPDDYNCAIEGENGMVCRSKKTASIKCLKGHNETRNEGELGDVTRFVCDVWDPPTGFGGPARDPRDEPPQAP